MKRVYLAGPPFALPAAGPGRFRIRETHDFRRLIRLDQAFRLLAP